MHSLEVKMLAMVVALPMLSLSVIIKAQSRVMFQRIFIMIVLRAFDWNARTNF